MTYRVVPLAQGSPDWHAWRRAGVGGSDLVGVLGLETGWRDTPTRADVLAEKVHGAVRESTFAMRRGQRAEAPARARYLAARRCACHAHCVERIDTPWAHASLDGLCAAPLCPDWLVEIKAPHQGAHALALEGQVPEYYRPQIQWQLWVTGLSHCDYVSVSEADVFPADERFAVVEVKADPQLQAWILEEAGRFWLEVLEARAANPTEATA